MMILVPGTVDEREALVEGVLYRSGFTKLGSVHSADGANYHYLPPGSFTLESNIDVNVYGLGLMLKPLGDFTVNSMYMNLNSGELFDPYGGLNDLEHRVLRTIKNPYAMFGHDPILVFRAIKIMCQLELLPEPETERALHYCAPLTLQAMAYIADKKDTLLSEWMLDNMFRGLYYDPARYFSLLQEFDILNVFTQFISHRTLGMASVRNGPVINRFLNTHARTYEENLSMFFSILARSISQRDSKNTFSVVLDAWGIRRPKRYHSFGADTRKIAYVEY